MLNNAHLSTEQMVIGLVWVTLKKKKNHIVKLVEKHLKGMALSYFFLPNIFK